MNNNLHNYRIIFITLLFAETMLMGGMYFYKILAVPGLSDLVSTEIQSMMLSILYCVKLLLLILVALRVKFFYKFFIIFSLITATLMILYEKMSLQFIIIESIIFILGVLCILCTEEKKKKKVRKANIKVKQ